MYILRWFFGLYPFRHTNLSLRCLPFDCLIASVFRQIAFDCLIASVFREPPLVFVQDTLMMLDLTPGQLLRHLLWQETAELGTLYEEDMGTPLLDLTLDVNEPRECVRRNYVPVLVSVRRYM